MCVEEIQKQDPVFNKSVLMVIRNAIRKPGMPLDNLTNVVKQFRRIDEYSLKMIASRITKLTELKITPRPTDFTSDNATHISTLGIFLMKYTDELGNHISETQAQAQSSMYQKMFNKGLSIFPILYNFICEEGESIPMEIVES
jgi:hypothetical protein